LLPAETIPAGSMSSTLMWSTLRRFLWWHLNQKRLPETRIHQSRRGGFHVLFRTDRRCAARPAGSRSASM
jgi:hypothetical protein